MERRVAAPTEGSNPSKLAGGKDVACEYPATQPFNKWGSVCISGNQGDSD